MPVVRISALPQQPATDVTRLLQRLCLRLAETDGVEPRHWWATWQSIEPAPDLRAAWEVAAQRWAKVAA